MRSASALALLLAVGVVVTAAAWTTVDAATSAPSENATASRSAGEVDAAALARDAAGRVVLGEARFTGTRVAREADVLVERSAYVDGLRHGLTERWGADGALRYRATYLHGRRDGTAETWWPDGTRRSESRYVAGVADGVQREWYRTGARFKELHLADGREAGLQRAWRENGILYTNYEARDGRIYGLKRATLCYELDGEQVVVNR